jgi:hypothetical protein
MHLLLYLAFLDDALAFNPVTHGSQRVVGYIHLSDPAAEKSA